MEHKGGTQTVILAILYLLFLGGGCGSDDPWIIKYVEDVGEMEADTGGGQSEDCPGDNNLCGGCDPLPHDPGDPCGPCDLDIYQCDGLDSVDCSGETPCGVMGLTGIESEDITTTSVRLMSSALWTEERDPGVTAHGFCLLADDIEHPPQSPQTDPDCSNLGALTFGAGEVEVAFEETVEDLTPGERYHVRAYVLHADGTGYSRAFSLITIPLPPENVELSLAGGVATLTWDASHGAAHYVVKRNGTTLDNQVEHSEYEDETLTAGATLPADGVELSASQGTHNNRVVLTWQAPHTPDSLAYSYVVLAENESGQSAPSQVAEGELDLAVLGYEVQADGGDWIDAGSSTTYEDHNAPPGSAEAGQARASDGVHDEFVRLHVEGAEALPGDAVPYRLRILNLAGPGAPSPEVTGFMGVELSYQWQRSAGPSDSQYADIPGAAATAHDDMEAPENGAVRYYRVAVGTGGGDVAYSLPDSGYRNAQPPEIADQIEHLYMPPLVPGPHPDHYVQIVTNLLFAGIPVVTDHGACIAQSSDFAEAERCVSLGQRNQPGEFQVTIANLEMDTRYWIRAYATNAVATVTSNTQELLTWPSPPQNVVASVDSTEHVHLSWDPVPNAIHYRVHRNGPHPGFSLIGDNLPDTHYTDISAHPSPVPRAPTKVMATTNLTDKVVVTWDPATTEPGTEHAYQVSAVNQTGMSTSEPATGKRAVRPVELYKVEFLDRGMSGERIFTLELEGGATQFTHRRMTSTINGQEVVIRRGPDPGTITGCENDDCFSAQWVYQAAPLDPYIRLRTSGVAAANGTAVAYKVWAINATGEGPMAETSGSRAVGPISYRWEHYKEVLGALRWTLLGNTDTSSYNHHNHSSDFKWYRVTLSAEGAYPDTVTSNSDGW